jgi:hypothetical protein
MIEEAILIAFASSRANRKIEECSVRASLSSSPLTLRLHIKQRFLATLRLAEVDAQTNKQS